MKKDIFYLLMTVICLIYMYWLHNKLFTSIDTHFIDEKDKNIRMQSLLENRMGILEQRLEIMENKIIEITEITEQTLLAVINSTAEETKQKINILDSTFLNLLNAQKRRTLEGLYYEAAVIEERKEAAAAFAAGRYITAFILYREIAAADPNDLDARFFQFYTLFLSNKQEKNNYRVIREAFTLLERQGYTRKEVTETLEFIALETELDGEER